MKKNQFITVLIAWLVLGMSTMATAVQPGEAEFNQAIASAIKGEFDKAKKQFAKSSKLKYEPRLMSTADHITVINDVNAKKIRNQTASLLFQAFAAMHKTEYERALSLQDAAIKANPNYAFGYYCRGYVHRMAGQNNKALVDLSSALKLGLDTTEVHRQLAKLYKKQGLYDFALISNSTAIQHSPKNRYLYLDRAEILNEMKQHEQALENITKAIALAPDVTSGYYFRAYTYMTYLNDMPKACQDYKLACERGDCGYYNEMCKNP